MAGKEAFTGIDREDATFPHGEEAQRGNSPQDERKPQKEIKVEGSDAWFIGRVIIDFIEELKRRGIDDVLSIKVCADSSAEVTLRSGESKSYQNIGFKI